MMQILKDMGSYEPDCIHISGMVYPYGHFKNEDNAEFIPEDFVRVKVMLPEDNAELEHRVYVSNYHISRKDAVFILRFLEEITGLPACYARVEKSIDNIAAWYAYQEILSLPKDTPVKRSHLRIGAFVSAIRKLPRGTPYCYRSALVSIFRYKFGMITKDFEGFAMLTENGRVTPTNNNQKAQS